MIITAEGLVWIRIAGGHGPRGEEFTEYEWEGNRRLSRIVQRPNQDEDFHTTYHVRGLAQIYATADAAVRAMAENPW